MSILAVDDGTVGKLDHHLLGLLAPAAVVPATATAPAWGRTAFPTQSSRARIMEARQGDRSWDEWTNEERTNEDRIVFKV